MWAIAILASLCGLRLIATTNLHDWATIGDPPIQRLHAAYTHGESIILDYTIEPLRTENATSDGARYWAVLPLPPRDRSPQYVIHRRPITPIDFSGATEIPVVDLRRHVRADQQDRMDHEQILAFIRPRFASGQREVYFHRSTYQPVDSGTTFSQTLLYIPTTNPTYGTMELFCNHPYDTYISPSRRLTLIVAWPFAVLGDWITAPLIPFIPKWN